MAQGAMAPNAVVIVEEVGHSLAEMEQLIAELVRLAETKRSVLLARDVGGLQTVVEQEVGLLARLDGAEGRRLKAVQRWATARGLSSGARTLTLSDLLLDEAGETARQVAATGARIRSAMEHLRRENALNDRLLAHSLAHVQAALNLLSGEPSDVTYDPNPAGSRSSNGRQRSNGGSRVIDQRV